MKDQLTDMKKLFESSDLSIFKKNLNVVSKLFSQSILTKYPSVFFDTWITTFGVTKKFTDALIDKINTEQDYRLKTELTHLFYSLIEKKYYNKSNIVHLENLLLSYDMYNHIVFLRMHVKDKIRQLQSDNLNFLVNLTKIGIVNEQINEKILKLSLNEYDSLIDIYDIIIGKMLVLTYDEQLKLVARVNPTIFQLLRDSTTIIFDDKKIQKLLSYASQFQNIDLYRYLLENCNATPSNTDILCMFGLTLTHKPALKTKINGRRYRRYISPTTRFRHKFNFDSSEYSSSHVAKLVELVKYYTDHSIELSSIVGIKHFVCYLVSQNYLELQLEICKNIGYKHGGHALRSLLYTIIKTNNTILLKKFIDYSQISTEKFVNGPYLSYAIKLNSFEIAQFMVDVLKMKTTCGAVIRGCVNIAKLKFLHSNNLPIQSSVMNTLFEHGDSTSIDYCMQTFNFKITSSMITQLLKSNNKNKLTLFKKYYDLLENKCNKRILLSVLSNDSSIFTLPIIKTLVKNIKIKSTLMLKILQTKNLKIIKYFCDTHKLNCDNVTHQQLKDLLLQTINKREFGRYYYGRKIYKHKSKFEKTLEVFKYIKETFPKTFEGFDQSLDEIKDNIFSSFVENGNNADVVGGITNVFNWKPSKNTMIRAICNSYAKTAVKLVGLCENFSQNDIYELLQKLNLYDHIDVFILCEKKYNVKAPNIINSVTLTEEIIYNRMQFSDYDRIVEVYNDIKLTPFIYSCYLINYAGGDRHRSSRSNKFRLDLLTNINAIYNKITQNDYDKLVQTFTTLPCNFEIVEYNMTDQEKKSLESHNLTVNYGNADFFDDIDENELNDAIARIDELEENLTKNIALAI